MQAWFHKGGEGGGGEGRLLFKNCKRLCMLCVQVSFNSWSRRTFQPLRDKYCSTRTASFLYSTKMMTRLLQFGRRPRDGAPSDGADSWQADHTPAGRHTEPRHELASLQLGCATVSRTHAGRQAGSRSSPAGLVILLQQLVQPLVARPVLNHLHHLVTDKTSMVL